VQCVSYFQLNRLDANKLRATGSREERKKQVGWDQEKIPQQLGRHLK
jgi:hypothetical protein